MARDSAYLKSNGGGGHDTADGVEGKAPFDVEKFVRDCATPTQPFDFSSVPPLGEAEPGETQLERWERELLTKSPFGYIGWIGMRDFVKKLLKNPRGRPEKKHVARAMKLEAQGRSRPEIFEILGITTKPEQRALKEAMRKRKSRLRGPSGALSMP